MIILAMTFSGSAVFLSILMSAVLGKKHISSAWVYNMLKINLIFFGFPLAVNNSKYKNRLLSILGIPRQGDIIDMATDNVIGIEESGRLYLNFQKYIILIWAVWISGLIFVMIRNMYKYNKVSAQKLNPRVSQSNYLEIFDAIKEELGMKKSVVLLCANDTETACTIGIIRQYVIVPESGMTDEEIYYSLKHELIHVKRSDIAWRYVGLLVLLMHWFNPLAYFYFYMMSVYCEQSCDAILVQNLDKAARKRYGQLIINMSQDDGAGKWKYQAYFGRSRKIIKWRLTSMLQTRKKKKFIEAASLLLSAAILFGGSLTVCAYENPQVIRGAEAPIFEVTPDEVVTQEFVAGEIRYSEEKSLDYVEFLGDDGTCYRLSEIQNSNIEKIGCNHSYVSGYYKSHHKNSDGSCKTDYYFAERCSQCGSLQLKGYSHTETSTVCTH